MKTREGFVGNSSSTSFIIQWPEKGFKNVKEFKKFYQPDDLLGNKKRNKREDRTEFSLKDKSAFFHDRVLEEYRLDELYNMVRLTKESHKTNTLEIVQQIANDPYSIFNFPEKERTLMYLDKIIRVHEAGCHCDAGSILTFMCLFRTMPQFIKKISKCPKNSELLLYNTDFSGVSISSQVVKSLKKRCRVLSSN